MLEKITIERFKTIVNAEVEFGRVNMFIGGNGSGKSNILEIIGVLSASLGRGLSDSDFLQRGVRLSLPKLMSSAFGDSEDDSFSITCVMFGDIRFRVTLDTSEGHCVVKYESCHHKNEIVFERPQDTTIAQLSYSSDISTANVENDRGTWDQIRALSKVPDEVRSNIDAISQYAIYSPQSHFLRGMQAAPPGSVPPYSAVGLHGEALPSAVLGLIRQLGKLDKSNSPEERLKRSGLDLAWLPGWADSIEVSEVDKSRVSKAVSLSDAKNNGKNNTLYFRDKYMAEDNKFLSAYDSSEGTLFLLFVAVLLVHDGSPKFIALDNADDALNPRMTRQMLETVIRITKESSKNRLPCGPRQVFLTSHNPTALDAFDLFDDDQRVFVVSRNQGGHTNINRLKPAEGLTREDWVQLQKGRSLSQMWIEGSIIGALGVDL